MNCFHLSVSLGYTTTPLFMQLVQYTLWIAFIYPYLWDTQQPITCLFFPMYSCELLSFIRIFGIHNNIASNAHCTFVVVNCFHLSVSLGYTTTISRISFCLALLWIAFIYPYLWDTQQLQKINSCLSNCCELLSFIRIFGIHNNQILNLNYFFNVVNCFHLSVSLGYTTTKF